jgi:predicted ArsR family transcriptional regulator
MTMGVLYDPSEDQRRTVKAMAGFGVPQDDIANYLDIDAKTLRKHFRRELDGGTLEANAKVAQSLFNMATSGRNVAAAIFWMKARAGWREKNELHVSLTNQAIEQMSDAELEEVIRTTRAEVKEMYRAEVTRELRDEWMRTEGQALIEATRVDDANVE